MCVHVSFASGLSPSTSPNDKYYLYGTGIGIDTKSSVSQVQT